MAVGETVKNGRRLAGYGLLALAAIALLLIVSGPQVLALEPSPDPAPSPSDDPGATSTSTASPTATSEVATSQTATPDPSPAGTTTPTSGASPTGDGGPGEAAPTSASVLVSTVESADVSPDPAGSPDPVDTAGPLGPADTDDRGDPESPRDSAVSTDVGEAVAAGHATATRVQATLSAYVQDIVHNAVVDLDGDVADCFCALAVSVSLDGPTNAVAALGRGSSGDVPTGSGAVVAASGRSGDATALSVTGGGSATSSAQSGSTGSVATVGAVGSEVPSRAAGARTRTTTIDVGRVTASLRTLVHGLGAEMGEAAGTDTAAHVDGLLAGARAADDVATGEVTVEVASWDREPGSSTGTIRCEADDGLSAVPSCGLAVAVTGGSGAHATVRPPTLSTSRNGAAGVGAPGMAIAISVAVSGTAVSSARTGDAGVLLPHGAPVEPALLSTEQSRSRSSAQSGSSGRSTAVALTVQGASATSARSGDTGSASSSVVLATGAPSVASRVNAPGSGGSAAAAARSGDSGWAMALGQGGSGAAGQARSGDTGDALASAADGAAGSDWTDSAPSDGDARVVGGVGGDGASTANSGNSGSTLSMVVAGGSAVASSTSGPTGLSSATSAGGKGGDTHSSGSGVDIVRTGDGGSATGTGRSGDTGAAVSVLVAPYDGTASGRSGGSGTVRASARGGDAGCASSGIDPDRACRPATNQDGPAVPTASGSGGAGFVALSSASTPEATDVPQPRRAKEPSIQAPARVEAHSAGTADVTCSATATSRTCSSPDSPAVSARTGGTHRQACPSPSGPPDADSNAVLVSTGTDALSVLAAGASPAPEAPARSVLAARESALMLLFNAAVPILALLSLLATFLTRKRRQALRSTYVPRHRRKQSLPSPSPRSR